MTVSTTGVPDSFALVGGTTVFNFTNKIFVKSDLVVIRTDTAGVETTLTITTDYTIAGTVWETGGSITTVTDYQDGTLTIKVVLPQTQAYDYTTADKFPAQSHEDNLDRAVLLIQALDEKFGRALLSKATAAILNLTIPVPSANQILGWNSGATNLENKSITDTSTTVISAFMATLLDDSTALEARTTLDAAALTVANVFTKTNYWKVGSSVAAASTVTLPTDGNIFHLTGTTTVNDFTHITGDGPFFIICDAITPLVHLAGTLELPGKANITTAVDDRFTLIQDGTTWMMVDYVRASGFPVLDRVVQVVNVQTGAVSTGTTILPHDDTIPQNTEGVEVMTLAITPTNTANILIIEVQIIGSPSVASWVSSALFQDTTAGALAASTAYMTLITGGLTQSFTHKMTAGTTSEITFKVRLGIQDAGTVTFNGSNGARILGGVAASSITITEYLP